MNLIVAFRFVIGSMENDVDTKETTLSSFKKCRDSIELEEKYMDQLTN